jgi:hypothetical protein
MARENMNIRNIILTVLLGVVVWLIAFAAGFWPKFHPSLALVTSILGAFVVLVILFLAKKTTVPHILLVVIGSAIGLVALSLIITGCRQVRITCGNPPTANPDIVEAYQWDAICWLPTTVGYTVEFKSSNLGDPGNGGRRSPVRNLAGTGEEITIRVLTSTSQSRTVDVQKGLFWYNIRCDNGNHVDPKVRIPPMN